MSSPRSPLDFGLFDTHCHLNDEAFAEDQEQVVEKAHEAGVEEMMVVGYDLPSSRRALKMTEGHRGVYAALGVHPPDAKTVTSDVFQEFQALLRREEVLAVGEIGLDFHYDYSPRDLQRQVFQLFLDLGKRMNKPVVIHDREAHGETLSILKEFATEHQGRIEGVMHCYSGSPEMLPPLLAMGFYISIAGPVTFKNARRLPEVVQAIPDERLLIETDSPYLAPHPYRGRRNEPSYLVEIAKRVAEIKGRSLCEIADLTTHNARQCFKLT